MPAYTGIGARELSQSIQVEFTEIGRRLALIGYTLRSGGAEGADLAFERGADKGHGKKEIFLPWKSFNHSDSTYILESPTPQGIVDIASKLYPRWDRSSQGVQRLHARNVRQILGQDLNDPSAFVVCYTERPYNDPNAIGGTLFGIKLAEANDIPVFNFYVRGDRERFYKVLYILETEGIDTSDIPELTEEQIKRMRPYKPG